jgi:aminoglycoside 6'-N-acetyltransferase
MRDGHDDYETMARWLSDERVLEFVYGRDNPFDYEKVIAKWAPRARGEDAVSPSIIELAGRPIGYIQYYPVHDPAEYELEDATGTYGIDLFIGEPERWNRGIGTRALSALVAYIFAELGATRIVIDPRIDNLRAIRSYEKCGFRKVKVLPAHELHEGARRDCWLMTIERGERPR